MNPIIFALSTALILVLVVIYVMARKYRSLVVEYKELDDACVQNTIKIRDLRAQYEAMRDTIAGIQAREPSGYEVERWTEKGPGETKPRLVYRNLFKEKETADAVAKSLDFENSKHPGLVTVTPLFKR